MFFFAQVSRYVLMHQGNLAYRNVFCGTSNCIVVAAKDNTRMARLYGWRSFSECLYGYNVATAIHVTVSPYLVQGFTGDRMCAADLPYTPECKYRTHREIFVSTYHYSNINITGMMLLQKKGGKIGHFLRVIYVGKVIS